MNVQARKFDGEGSWRFTGAMMVIGLLAFFGTTFVANGALVYYALSTFSGEEEASPYEHGLAYDHDIAAAHEQDARGWRVTLDAKRAPGDPEAVVTLKMRDAADAPIAGMKVSAALLFPTNKAFDRSIALAEVAPGEYRGAAAVRAGQWDVDVAASREGDTQFRSHNRVDLP